jgi:hypothetical protein
MRMNKVGDYVDYVVTYLCGRDWSVQSMCI